MSKGQKQTSTTSVPDWENNAWQGLISNANSTTQNDINSVDYGGIQNTINGSTQNILGNQVDPSIISNGIMTAGSSKFTDPGVAASYMNPYESTALASQVNLDRNSILNPELAQSQAYAAASGALGGDRSAVLQGQLINNFNNTEANTIAQGENTAFNAGQSAYETDANRNLQGQTSGVSAQLGAAGQNVVANTAATQNQLAGISASEAPEQQLATQAGIYQSLPNQSTTQQTTTPNGGALGGILGGILGGAGTLLKGISSFNGKAHGGLIGPKKKKTRRAPKKKKGARKGIA